MTWKISPFSLLNNNDENNSFLVLGIQSHESHNSSEALGQDTNSSMFQNTLFFFLPVACPHGVAICFMITQ